MEATETRAVIDRYFDLMGRGEDFAVCYAADARWTTFDSGTVVSGPTEIRDYLIGLHRNMPDIQTRPLAYAARPPMWRATAPIRAGQAPIE